MKTTRKILMSFVFALISMSAFSQFSLGLRTGVNWANINTSATSGGTIPNVDFLPSANFAVVAEIGVSENFAFQPELAYTQKGFQIREGFDFNLFNLPIFAGVQAQTKINYLEIPLLAKYKFGNEGIKGYVTAGPTLGYAINGRLETKASFIIDIPLTNTKIDMGNDNFNRFEVGATIGAGVAIPAGSGELFLDARYTHGLTKVDNISFAELALKNKVIGLSLGYKIPFGG